MSRRAVIFAAAGIVLAGCSSGSRWGGSSAPATPPAQAEAPPAPGITPEDLVGRWGFASYQNESDRGRTTTQARGQCSNAYVINRGPSGGVLMHLPDQPQPSELRTKGAPDGKRYLGPAGPAGDSLDREIVSFDGRLMVLRWVDPEVAGRYGTSVYVRCAPRVASGARSARRQRPAPAPPAQ